MHKPSHQQMTHRTRRRFPPAVLSFNLAMGLMVAALVFGVVLGRVLPRGPSVPLVAAGQIRLSIPADTYTAQIWDVFPEAYREYSTISYRQIERDVYVPARITFFMPARRFGPEFNDNLTPDSIRTIARSFESENPMTREQMVKRVEALTLRLRPEGASHCQQFRVATDQTIREPSWSDRRVREVQIDLNLGC